MNAAIRGTAIVLAVALLQSALGISGARAAATPDPRCSHDTLAINGPVSVVLCASKTDAKTVTVDESFVGKSASFSHGTTIDVIAGQDSSRGIDDVPLSALGLTTTLHLAMHYKNGTIVLEHALLLPGAVQLK
jgi:hypothetical protein